MLGAQYPSNELETADEYGRYEGCFRDHRAAPFRLSYHLPHLQQTLLPKDADGFVRQECLHRGRITAQPVDFRQDCIAYSSNIFLCSLSESVNNLEPLWLPLSTKRLKLTSDDLDIGSDPSVDYKYHLRGIAAKCSTDLRNQWLPLISVRTDNDEGLEFPPNAARLRLLMQREVDRECVPCTYALDRDESFLDDFKARNPTKENLDTRMQRIDHIMCVKHVTPPLTPVSCISSPYIPDGDITVIDLTSEPCTPLGNAVRKLEHGLKTGQIESGPTVPDETILQSSPSHLPRVPSHSEPLLQSLKVELPLAFSSSNESPDHDFFTHKNGLQVVEEGGTEPALNTIQQGYFEDAISIVLEDRHKEVMRMAEQEFLDPFDSISRVPVPVLSFDVPLPAWNHVPASAEEHFRWIREDKDWKLPGDPKTSTDRRLRWMPVGNDEGRISLMEEFPTINALGQNVTWDATPVINNATYACCPDDWAILRVEEDDINELLPFMTDFSDYQILNEPLEAHSDLTIETGQPATIVGTASSQHAPTGGTLEYSTSLLGGLNETGATERLLSSFMELRAVKKPRLADDGKSNKTATRLSGTTIRQPQRKVDEPSYALMPAPTPEVEIPKERGRFMVSLHLGSQLLRHIENRWSAEALIDRDYSGQNSLVGSSSYNATRMTVPLECEADVSLTATAGIVVTNLLKLRQKPLPGSKSQPPFREYIRMLAQKYEALFILVTESNPAGEFVGAPSLTDVAGFTDFMVFTTVLDATITTVLVPDATATLGQWIMALMCRYNSQSLLQKHFLSSVETTWEKFLRYTGMNTTAAQVLAGTLLNDAGGEGLAQFIAMPVAERLLKYGHIVGSRNILIPSSTIMDQRWS